MWINLPVARFWSFLRWGLSLGSSEFSGFRKASICAFTGFASWKTQLTFWIRFWTTEKFVVLNDNLYSRSGKRLSLRITPIVYWLFIGWILLPKSIRWIQYIIFLYWIGILGWVFILIKKLPRWVFLFVFLKDKIILCTFFNRVRFVINWFQNFY